MSWISDTREGIRNLDLSRKNLRQFGLLVGGVFLVIAAVLFIKGSASDARFILGGIGLFLFSAGGVIPGILGPFYRVWMGFALAVGWVVSRILLSILFLVVITPIGLVMRLLGKHPLDVAISPEMETYWVRRGDKEINYEKMF